MNDFTPLDTMWQFLQFGGQKGDPEQLSELCETLQHLMMQKTAGQRKDKKKDVPFEDLPMVINGIVIEAMALWLSGDLELLRSMKEGMQNEP